MASITSTTTPTLRVNAAKGVTENQQQPHGAKTQPPEGSASYDHFFWTYTEEPHRSRRQAIIKAHPEVCSPPFSAIRMPSSTKVQLLITTAYRSQSYAVLNPLRNGSCSPSSLYRLHAHICSVTLQCSHGNSS